MKSRLLIIITSLLVILSCSPEKDKFTFESDDFELKINQKGHIVQFLDKATGNNYLAKDTLAPLLAVRIDGQMQFPREAALKGKVLKILYPDGIEAKVEVLEKASHISFQLTGISDKDRVELVVWGPYPTTIDKIIGETVGVVRGEEYAIGLQALNPKTLGGYPWNDNDCMPQLDIFESGDYSDLSEEGKRHVLYRVEAAKPAGFGSTLQAYCRNRDEERVTANWGHERYTIPPFEDGGVAGSRIALFGCPVDKALETIGKIEMAEGLPHPLIDGKWGKTAPQANAAYMIMEFGEDNVDQAIAYTQKAGLRYLYHPGPFLNWGHFELQPGPFPNGWDGLKACSDKAKAKGIYTGVHTLSNFITTNDPYVTPVPDERLAEVGSSVLSESITAVQTEIPVAAPDFFNQYQNNHLKTVRIGDELIRYGAVSESAPWKLLDCQRGAFGTTAAAHEKDTRISKLADHGYKVFLTNPELTIEMSKKVAELFNYCNLRQISFDGLEGNRSTGMGNYGEILFTTTWYDHLSDEIKEHFIADASRTSHYFWHIYSRMNWGEPWYAGFRESQTEYRLKNQKYFQRNFMPGMLGWFSMLEGTSVEDIEWMLARSAGFDAGYGFVTSFEVLEQNGQAEAILQLLGEWEEARMANVFTEDQKQRMQDIKNEFRLEGVSEKEWKLQQIDSYKFKHEAKVRQPGEPLHSTFDFQNEGKEQPLRFIITAVDATIFGLIIEIDNHKTLKLPLSLQAGQHLKYTGGDTAVQYSSSWQKIKEIPIDKDIAIVKGGMHRLNFDCAFSSKGKEPLAKLEVRLLKSREPVRPATDK